MTEIVLIEHTHYNHTSFPSSSIVAHLFSLTFHSPCLRLLGNNAAEGGREGKMEKEEAPLTSALICRSSSSKGTERGEREMKDELLLFLLLP